MSQHATTAFSGPLSITLRKPQASDAEAQDKRETSTLLRAFGFTKRTTRQPLLGRRKPIRRLAEQPLQMSIAPRQFEIIDGVDERLLPWSFDEAA